MGPPMTPPYWLRLSVSCLVEKWFFAFISPLRKNSKSVPWNGVAAGPGNNVHDRARVNAILRRQT